MGSGLRVLIKIAIPLAGLALSALCVWIAGLRGVSIDPAVQLLLIVSGGILTAVLELVVISAERNYQHEMKAKTWAITHRAEVELENLRATFPRIVQDSYSADADLYVEYFVRRFGELAREIIQAADSGVLRVTHAHAMSIDNVLAAFADDQEKILRYVWPLEPQEHPFADDATWKAYFQRTVHMTRKREIKEIRVLFVIDPRSARNDAELVDLFAFFKNTRSLQCKLLAPATYRNVCNDYSVPQRYEDFGIYGKLLYCGEGYVPEVVGEYTKDVTSIEKYKALFDTLWGGPDAEDNPSTAASAVEISELLNDRRSRAAVGGVDEPEEH